MKKKFLETKRFFLKKGKTINDVLNIIKNATCILAEKDYSKKVFLSNWYSYAEKSKKQPRFFFHANISYEFKGKEIEGIEACLLSLSSGMLTVFKQKNDSSDVFPITPSLKTQIDGFAILPPWSREIDKNEEIEEFLNWFSKELESFIES